jgi:hypothetical protein
MFPVALQNVFGEKTPYKKYVNLHPKRGNLLKSNFTVVYKASLHITK